MANEVKIDIIANTDKFQTAINKASDKITSFGAKNRELSSVLDSEFRNISKAANNMSGDIGSAFNSLNIKSDFGFGELKKTIENDRLFFQSKFKAIVEDANTTFADVQRARRSLASIESTFDAQYLKNEFSSLGISSAASIEAAKIKIENAYMEIASSGKSSASDITRAYEAMTSKIAELDNQLVTSAEKAAAERTAVMKSSQASYMAQAMSDDNSASKLIGQQLAGSDFSKQLQAELSYKAEVDKLHDQALAEDLRRNQKRIAAETEALNEMKAVQASYAVQGMADGGSAAKLIGQHLAGSDFSKQLQAELSYKAEINSLHEQALLEDSKRAQKRIEIEAAALRKITLLHKEAAVMNADYDKGLLDGEGVYKNAQRASEGFKLLSLTSVAAIAKVQILYSLVNNVMGAIASFPSTAIDAIEQFNASSIKNAAVITSMENGARNIGEAYKENKQYADAVQNSLIKMDSTTIASYTQLQKMNDAFVQQGVYIDVNNKKQIDGYRNIANALGAITANMPNADMQFSQEITALMTGQNRPGDLLTKQLKAIDPLLEEHLIKWRQIADETNNAGYVLEKVGPLLSGYAAASGDINGLWTTIKSTLKTIYEEDLREGLKEGFEHLVVKMRELAKWAEENKEKIQQFLRDGFASAEKAAGYIWDIGKAMSALAEPAAYALVVAGLVKMATAVEKLIALYKALKVAQAASTVATGLGAAVAGGLALPVLAAGVVGAGTYYGASKAMSWADKKLYQSTGINLTGKAMYEENEAKNQEATRKYNEAMARKQAASVKTPNAVPYANEEERKKAQQIEEQIDEKYLAYKKSFNDNDIQEQKDTLKTKLEDLKNQNAEGLISTQEYYNQRLAITKDANTLELNAIAEKMEADQAAADKYAQSDKREDYIKELEYLTKVNESYKQYVKLEQEGERAIKAAKEEQRKAEKAANQEAVTETNKLLEMGDDIVELEKRKQAAYMETDKYKKLTTDSKTSNAAKTAKEAIDIQNYIAVAEKQNTLNKTMREYSETVLDAKNAIDKIYGYEQKFTTLAADYRSGINAELTLQEQLTLFKEKELRISKLLTSESSAKLEKERETLELQIKLQQLKNAGKQKELADASRGAFLTGNAVGSSGSYQTDLKGNTVWVEKLILASEYTKEQYKYASDAEVAAAAKSASASDKLSAAGDTLNNSGNALGSAATGLVSSASFLTSSASSMTSAAEKLLSYNASGSDSSGGGSSVSYLDTGFYLDNLDGKATGGDVDPYTPYIVGEKGPELFMTKQAGTIIPNNKLSSVGNGGSNSVNVSGGVNVILPNVTAASDYATIAKGVMSELTKLGSRRLSFA